MLPKVSRNGNTGEHATKHGAGLGQTEDKEEQLRKRVSFDLCVDIQVLALKVSRKVSNT